MRKSQKVEEKPHIRPPPDGWPAHSVNAESKALNDPLKQRPPRISSQLGVKFSCTNELLILCFRSLMRINKITS